MRLLTHDSSRTTASSSAACNAARVGSGSLSQCAATRLRKQIAARCLTRASGARCSSSSSAGDAAGSLDSVVRRASAWRLTWLSALSAAASTPGSSSAAAAMAVGFGGGGYGGERRMQLRETAPRVRQESGREGITKC